MDGIPSPKFVIGQTVYLPDSGRKIRTHCPACFGKKTVKVILGDDSIVEVACEGCKYEGQYGSCGYINEWDLTPQVTEALISAVNSYDNGVWRYNTNYSSINYCSDDSAFATKEEALAKAKQICEERDKENHMKRKNKKELATEKVGWHVRYHKQNIREYQKKIDWHQSKLAAKAEVSKPERSV